MRTMIVQPKLVRVGVLATALGLCAWLVQSALAEPKPSIAPTTWELKFTFQNPQRIVLKLPGESQSTTYWYMPYRVLNLTSEDRDFMPQIERISEIDTELPAERVEDQPDAAPRIISAPAMTGLDPAVFRAIQSRLAKTHPFLVPPVEAIGRIKQGRDYAVDSVAVFEDLDPRINKFTIYVGGLTGERTQQANPNYDPDKPRDDSNPRYFTLQKTLAIPYVVPGDVSTRKTVDPTLGRLHWVMR
jgi:hypothetical protein